jgi:hypothetical protein
LKALSQAAKVMTSRQADGTRQLEALDTGNVGHVTAMVTICALPTDAPLLPTLFVASGLQPENAKAQLLPALVELLGDVPPIFYRVSASPTGFVRRAEFQLWFLGLFVPEVRARRQRLGVGDAPAVLFVDSCKSRYVTLVVRAARAHRIHIILGRPATTSVTQPLDVGFFGPAKSTFRRLVKEEVSEWRMPCAAWRGLRCRARRSSRNCPRGRLRRSAVFC